MLYTATISDASVYGITAAREAYNAALPSDDPARINSDSAYIDFVLESAIKSWCEQYAPVVAPVVPVVQVAGIPQSVPRRQAKTVMELTPNATYGDLWQAALAAAGAIEDKASRIMTTNYLLESLYFEHPKVSELAVGLLGMTQAQVDQLFIAASKL